MKSLNIIQKSGQERQLANYSKNLTYSQEARDKFFRQLIKHVKSIQIQPRNSMWSQYYQDMDSFFSINEFNQKQKIIHELINKHKPDSVIDMGCNVGGYSIIAAQLGAKVIAFDTDEDSINLLYRLAKERKLNILPLVGNVLYA